MILVYLENNAEKLPKHALIAIAAALRAKQVYHAPKVVGLLVGSEGVVEAAAEAAKYGLDEVLYLRDAALGDYLVTSYAAVITSVVNEQKPNVVIAASTSRGKDLLPRIAYALGAGQASDALAINDDGTIKRPMYAGNVIADVELLTAIKAIMVRTTAFDPAAVGSSVAPVRELKIASPDSAGMEFVAFETVKSERPELTEAEIVVSGGRALKSAENFEKVIAPLADVLGAAIGASRAAVDSGYAPNDWQVGQTGKVVAPALYIAVGISGAIQHLAGMKDSKVIVAINQDSEAPIFEVADYGLVADLFQAVPELTAELKKIRS